MSIYEGLSRTRSGIGLGSTARELARVYPGRLTDGGRQEGGNRMLVYVPQDSQDQAYRIVFNVNEEDARVNQITVGKLPDILSLGEASRCFEG